MVRGGGEKREESCRAGCVNKRDKRRWCEAGRRDANERVKWHENREPIAMKWVSTRILNRDRRSGRMSRREEEMRRGDKATPSDK
jgi:hypothetical protein